MELLSPAGNFESAIAAFHGGADAVYVGGKSFSARMGADNFTNEELTRIADFAHQIGKKVYVTLNTLLFEDEFLPAVEFAFFCDSIGIDGIIVQDLGLAYYLHQTLPSLPLHASTQLNCHNIEQAKALKQIGFVRVVLAREAKKEFISEVKGLGLDVEVFVHGALCVSCSGNCLLSSFIGGRSGNRGRCAQPCRMPYDIFEDGAKISGGVYAISTKDLQTIDDVKTLKELRTDSLKIEGRLKSKEYVFQTSLAYSEALRGELHPEEKEKLQSLYSRGFTKGYLFGESPFRLLSQRSSSHQGEEIGTVVRMNKGRVSIRLTKRVHRLDGVRFLSARPFGVTLEKMFVNGIPVETAEAGSTIEITRIENASEVMKAKVIRTTHHELEASIDRQINLPFRVPVSGTFFRKIGEPMRLTLKHGSVQVEVIGAIAESPKTNGTSLSRIQEQLSKSGNYPYVIASLKILGEDAFLPISALNAIRNEAFEALAKQTIVRRNSSPCPYQSPEPPAKNLPEKIMTSWETNPEDSPLLHDRWIEGKLTHAPLEILPFACLVPDSVTAISSPYCNITNSYALDAFVSLGFSGMVLSLELDERSIDLLLDSYRSRHKTLPSLGMFIYGRPEVMLMKSCPIGTLTNSKALHCQKCHQHRYCMQDILGERYPILGDSHCVTRIYGSKRIHLLEQIPLLKQKGLSFFLYHFTDEGEEQRNGAWENDLPYTSKFHTNGHFRKRSL